MTMPSLVDTAGPKVKSPAALAHVVLVTNNFKKMVEFYKTFLGAHAAFENEVISFLTYDEEHHRIAILQRPDTESRAPKASGLEHIAFTFENLDDLALAYKQRKTHNMKPYACINHGNTVSIYYKDPDGNKLETQVDCFDTPEAATKFMVSPEFVDNPIGVYFDPESLVQRLASGEDHRSIKNRVETDPRAGPDF